MKESFFLNLRRGGKLRRREKPIKKSDLAVQHWLLDGSKLGVDKWDYMKRQLLWWMTLTLHSCQENHTYLYQVSLRRNEPSSSGIAPNPSQTGPFSNRWHSHLLKKEDQTFFSLSCRKKLTSSHLERHLNLLYFEDVLPSLLFSSALRWICSFNRTKWNTVENEGEIVKNKGRIYWWCDDGEIHFNFQSGQL